MSVMSKSPRVLSLVAMLAVPASVATAQQAQEPPAADVTASYDAPAELSEGPQIKGIISARSGDRIQVTGEDGTATVVAVNETTKISASKGLFSRARLTSDQLLNGTPVTVKTLQSGQNLLASQIKLTNKDLRTASMIRNGTAQGFAEQTAATDALRGRFGDIGQYNIKNTTNVNFAVGKANLTDQAKADLCAAASAAEGMPNAQLLVVGYTDSTGSEELNQVLSEKRAGRVVNYLQQACGWKPYRMLTPTGMAEADPAADNDSYEGKAQNRRVAVNVLVSKAAEGM